MDMQTWVYPWDVAAGGVDAVLGELRDLGLDGLNLTTNYHPIGTLSPRGAGRRILYTELGAVFFPARAERYGRIRPHLWPDPEVMRVWPAVAERAGTYGLQLNAWTIGMFQPWIAHQCPDCARETPTGDRFEATVCPGHPDVQDFFAALCADVAERFPVETIELEGIGFHHFTYGWVRPRILIEIAPWTEWLLDLCFCGSCRARASARGVDVEGLRARVVAEIERCFAAEADADPARPLDEQKALWLSRDGDLREFVQAREDAVVELVIRIADAVADVSPTCRLGVWGPVQVDGSAGVDLARVIDRIGSVLVWRPGERPEAAARIRALADGAPNRVAVTHFQACGWPHGTDSPALRSEIEAALDMKADRIGFYNYGLLRRGQLARLVALTRERLAARAGS